MQLKFELNKELHYIYFLHYRLYYQYFHSSNHFIRNIIRDVSELIPWKINVHQLKSILIIIL